MAGFPVMSPLFNILNEFGIDEAVLGFLVVIMWTKLSWDRWIEGKNAQSNLDLYLEGDSMLSIT